MAKNDGLNGPGACQQALGAHLNVVVEVRTCEVPDIVNAYDPAQGFPKNPDWATPDADRSSEKCSRQLPLDNRFGCCRLPPTKCGSTRLSVVVGLVVVSGCDVAR